MSNYVQFPFNSPLPREAPDTPNPVNSPETPQSPTPSTLPIKKTSFKYPVTCKQSPGDAHIFQATSTPQMASSATFNQPQSTNPFDHLLTFPQSPPRIHAREEVQSPAPFEHSNGRLNPFSDEYAVTPPKPWVKSRGRNGSETSSVNSAVTFNTATLVNYSLPHREIPSDERPSLSRAPRRSTKDSHFSLDREVRLREAAKRQERKLRLERARDEVRRLDPSASTSRLHLPSVKSFNARSKDYKNPVPSLVTNGLFWCALLLAQTGLVSTGAAFAILMRDRKNGSGAGTVFWLVCSIGALVIGGVGTGVMCARKGNACLGTQDKLGFNEIRDLSGEVDVESGRRGGRLLYLGVGERDEGSVLGGRSLREDNSVRFVRGKDGGVGEWVDGNGKGSIDSSLKDPMWKDLYLTPCSSRAGGNMGSPERRTRSRLRDHDDDSDLGTQRLMPTPPLIRISDDGESSTRIGERREISGLDSSRAERKGGETDYQSIRRSTKSSMVSAASTLNNWAGAAGPEIQTWSPLTRLERVLNGDVPTVGATRVPQKKIKDGEGMELIDMSVPYDKVEVAKAEGKKGKGIKWVSEQVADYHGFWSPEIIQQGMRKCQEEKDKERLEQIRAEKTKMQGVNVRERAKHFEDPAAQDAEEKKAQDSSVFVVGDDSEG
jgi:hypothetical protein